MEEQFPGHCSGAITRAGAGAGEKEDADGKEGGRGGWLGGSVSFTKEGNMTTASRHEEERGEEGRGKGRTDGRTGSLSTLEVGRGRGELIHSTSRRTLKLGRGEDRRDWHVVLSQEERERERELTSEKHAKTSDRASDSDRGSE